MGEAFERDVRALWHWESRAAAAVAGPKCLPTHGLRTLHTQIPENFRLSLPMLYLADRSVHLSLFGGRNWEREGRRSSGKR